MTANGNSSETQALGWTAHDRTMVLPAFVTSSKVVVDEVATPAVVVAEPAKKPVAPDHGDKLPSSERGMLVFVSMLLAVGTLAIVAMALTSH